MLQTDSPEMVRASFENAEKSVELWSSGNRDAALEQLLSSFKENPICGGDWSWLAATWEMELGLPGTKVIGTLWHFPSWVPEWHIANALVLYRQLGDNAVSRAALSSGLPQSSSIVRKLLEKTSEALEDGLELEGPYSYPEHAIKIWRETPNALQWLADSFNRSVLATGELPLEPNESQRRHHKLWSDHFHFASVFLERKEDKKARKYLLSALREARHLGVLSWEFESTVAILLLNLGAEPQLENALREQVRTAEILSTRDPLKAVHAYTRIAKRFDELGNPADADDCYRAALKSLESVSAEEKSDVDNCQRADLLEASAAFWIKEEGLRRSISLYTEAIELRGAYLGDKHPQLLDTMISLHECLICLGDTSAANELRNRMLYIDPNADESLKLNHGHLYLPAE